MKNIIVLTFASILLQGCLGKKNEITEDVVFLQSVPVCNTPEMCKKMWDAAGEWVDKYSPQGIDTYTDDMIRSEDKDNSSDEMEIVIKRIKQGNASYKILIDTICTNSISSCSLERNNMLAFNKKLIGFMSVKEKTKKEKVFDANAALNLWLKHYVEAFNKYDAGSFSRLLHFPVTLIEKDTTKVLSSVEDLKPYFNAQKRKMASLSGDYIVLENMKVSSRAGRNLFVNVVFSINDAENASVSVRKVDIHLIEDDKQLKMISFDSHD